MRDGDGKLANRFILVSNLVASDGGAAIAAGNGRVVRARLSDARHFWLTDLAPLPDYKDKAAKPLDQRLAKLERWIVFHEKLGTQGERVERIAALARELAPQGRRRPGPRRARRASRQGRSGDRNGRRIPRAAGPDGALLRDRAGRGAKRRRRDRGALQAAGAERPRPDFAGVDRRRARRQARHARRLLGDRREADRQQGPLCAAPGGARRDPDRAGERAQARFNLAAERRLWAVMLDIEFAREDEAGAVVHSLERRGFPEGPELDEVVGRLRPFASKDARLRTIARIRATTATSSPSSPTASRSICATRARGTTSSTRCSRCPARTIF